MRRTQADEEPVAESKTGGCDEHEPVLGAPVGRGETRSSLNLRIVLPGVKPEDSRVAMGAGRALSAGWTHSWVIAFWLVALVALGAALWITLFGVGLQS